MDMLLRLFMTGNRESRTHHPNFLQHDNTSNFVRRAMTSHGTGREVKIKGG